MTRIPFPASAVDPPDGFDVLFNGENLDGWHGMAPHGGMRDEFSKHWRVEDGALVNDGAAPSACTDASFGDIELTLQHKNSIEGDSGVYLRGVPSKTPVWWIAESDVARSIGMFAQ